MQGYYQHILHSGLSDDPISFALYLLGALSLREGVAFMGFEWCCVGGCGHGHLVVVSVGRW